MGCSTHSPSHASFSLFMLGRFNDRWRLTIQRMLADFSPSIRRQGLLRFLISSITAICFRFLLFGFMDSSSLLVCLRLLGTYKLACKLGRIQIKIMCLRWSHRSWHNHSALCSCDDAIEVGTTSLPRTCIWGFVWHNHSALCTTSLPQACIWGFVCLHNFDKMVETLHQSTINFRGSCWLIGYWKGINR